MLLVFTELCLYMTWSIQLLFKLYLALNKIVTNPKAGRKITEQKY